MNTAELRTKTEPELLSLLEDMRNKLRNYTFELAAGKIKNVRAIHETKRDIARVLTILHRTQHAGR